MIHSSKVHHPFNGTMRHWPWFPLQISQRKILLAGVDLTLLNLAMLLGLHLRMDMPLYFTTIALHPTWFATLTLLWLTIAAASDNYEIQQADQLSSSLLSMVKALLITGIIYTFLPMVSPPLTIEESPIIVVGIVAAGLLALWRSFYALILSKPIFQRRALIVGNSKAGHAMAKAIENYRSSYEIVGLVGENASEQVPDIKNIAIFGNGTDLTTLVKDRGVTDIVLSYHHGIPSYQLQAALQCFQEGVRIVMMPQLFEEITCRIPVEHIDEHWLAHLPIDKDFRRPYLILKRALDLLIASFGLILLAPLFPILALAIKLDSPGPIFYRPERLGRGGKPFRLWKFRTMVSDADRVGDPTFTTTNDERITRVGRLLRTTHIDELPQFHNIIEGDMSLVGPRPERYVPKLEEDIPYYRTRYAVRPGAVGWALVNQGYAEGVKGTLVKLQYDLYYIKHQSLYLDILILCKSIIHMLTMRGQ